MIGRIIPPAFQDYTPAELVLIDPEEIDWNEEHDLEAAQDNGELL